MEQPKITTVIFDLGGVLVDWNPEYLYAKIFDEIKMKWFLRTICTQAWNIEQDAGRSFEKGCSLLAREYPEYSREIWMFFERWEEMLKGEISDTVMILKELSNLNKVTLYALTNWSAETFPIAKQRFEFLKLFKGIVVSGEENTRKPFSEIYEIILERYSLEPGHCLFIDDSRDNVSSAKSLGINALHFTNPDQLKQDLRKLRLL
jgi:2-haloacid dehalogenase